MLLAGFSSAKFNVFTLKFNVTPKRAADKVARTNHRTDQRHFSILENFGPRFKLRRAMLGQFTSAQMFCNV